MGGSSLSQGFYSPRASDPRLEGMLALRQEGPETGDLGVGSSGKRLAPGPEVQERYKAGVKSVSMWTLLCDGGGCV